MVDIYFNLYIEGNFNNTYFEFVIGHAIINAFYIDKFPAPYVTLLKSLAHLTFLANTELTKLQLLYRLEIMDGSYEKLQSYVTHLL